MSKKAQDAYKELAKALNALEDGPQCADPLYTPFFFVEPQYDLGKLSPRKIQLQMDADEFNAKIICNQCPVKMLCAEYAIVSKENFGIWGGTTPAERSAISSARSSKPEFPVEE